jgi:hypothetical protein
VSAALKRLCEASVLLPAKARFFLQPTIKAETASAFEARLFV